MITQLSGRLIEKFPTHVVIDCNGVGYEVHISLHTFGQLGDDENIRLYTHLQVREDAHTLFGFFQPMERSIFRLLISISGIGASIARTMLSSMTPNEIQHAIVHEDLA
ncbi:Holliday junction branch migration protein RuvA, partial [Flavobacteriaceae bacterium]|nr:Holliday junction branch migration protein RuvA [Flavobacteriaceae bacterium]